MERVGYEHYVAQGGDWGSAVTAQLGRRHPNHCIAVHMTLAMGARPKGEPTTPEELHAIERAQYYLEWDSGYSTQQKSRPQTVGYGLTDSPAGQAAWILEKFWAWTDNDGRPEDAISRDDLLDNVMMYWVTETAASSARIYWESFGGGGSSREPVAVPAGFGVYPAEIVPPVRAWLDDAFPNIVHWAEFDRGGHFAAFEMPGTFVLDIRAFARLVR